MTNLLTALVLIVAAETASGTGDLGLRPAAVLDVQDEGIYVTLEDTRRDRSIALAVMKAYLRKWCNPRILGRSPDILDYMSVYRAGPDGWRNKYDWYHYYEQGKRNLKEYRQCR